MANQRMEVKQSKGFERGKRKLCSGSKMNKRRKGKE